MRIPPFSEEKCRPLPEVINDIIRSFTLEKVALANLINAEAEKIQAFVGERFNFPTNPSSQEILQFNQTTHRLMEAILMEEWLLLKKLETVIRLEKEDIEEANKK
jgi:hypothetical protein